MIELTEAIKTRHSVRQYLNKAIDADTLGALQTEIAACNKEGKLHFQLVTDEPKAFDGFMAHYGKFSGVTSYIALIGRKGDDLEEKCGYYGERLVLRAQQLGLNTCCDEYANDVYSSGSMGFGNLVSTGKYGSFVTYVNNLAAIVKNAGMTPMAFNDGFYFNGNTSSGTFDTDIMISFWTSGWSGYQSESASALAARGHKMINTNGDY